MSDFSYLSALSVDFIDRLDGVEMINTGVQPNLVHDDDSSSLDFGVEGADGGGDVAGGDDVGLSLDGGLDDGDVVGVRDQRDDQVEGGNLSLELGCVVHVESDGRGVGETFTEGLSGREGSAG